MPSIFPPRSLAVASMFGALVALSPSAGAQAALHISGPARLFAGTTVQLSADSPAPVRWSTDDPTRAWVDASGRLVLMGEGRVRISAANATDSVARELTIERNPAKAIALSIPATPSAGGRARISAVALDGDNRPLPDVPVSLATSDGILMQEGDSTVLVATRSGELDVIAQSGDAAATAVLHIADAGVVQQGTPESVAPHTAATSVSPVRRLVLRTNADRLIAVGDTVELNVEAWGLGARRISNPGVMFAVVGAPRGAATVTANGRFVATEAGMYTVVAAAGTHADRQTIFVAARR